MNKCRSLTDIFCVHVKSIVENVCHANITVMYAQDFFNIKSNLVDLFTQTDNVELCNHCQTDCGASLIHVNADK